MLREIKSNKEVRVMAKPKDNAKRKTGSRGRAIVHFQIDSNHWDYREETGNDYGRDCVLELSENDEWHNHKVEGQIKGTGSIKVIEEGTYISFPMPVNTIEYALGTSCAFVLFVADTKTNVVYYQCVQDYFIENKNLFGKLEQGTINIRIPVSQNLENGDELLQELAKITFVDGPGSGLKRYTK